MTHIFLTRQKKALTLLGHWFPTKKYRILYLIYRCFLLFIQWSFLLFNIIYMRQVWGDLEETSEGSYLLFTHATLSLKSTIFLMSKNRWSNILNFMESDIFAAQTSVHEKILSVDAMKMWSVYAFFITSATFNCIEWAVVPLLDNHGERVFPFKIWMPADPTKSPEYHIGYVYQVMAIYINAATFLTMDYLTASLIMFAATQLGIIEEKIKQIPATPLSATLEEKNKLINQNNEILNECIQHHQAVIRFVRLVENMFNVNVFFQMSGTVAIICVISFRMTIEPPNSIHFFSTLNYLISILAQLYLYCWSGSELTDRSQILRDTLYTSTWYEQDQRFKKTLAIAMECMKRPIVYRAGYLIPLSRPTFVSVLRCSYSYFAVLNQVNNK
ncbi:hypothetical protein ABMA28_007901 [Loxostege sticticalis]|uniref:Odorant receptor n=1 Tax=Loxostege sticticalis TaxID=481309 RepID=A0ABD0SN56_LOXSC